MSITDNKIPEAVPWRFCSLHPPGRYIDHLTRRPVWWSGVIQTIENWQQAEMNAAAQMRALGYFSAECTPPGADKGIDVRSSRALAQVKYTISKPTRMDLQQLHGARKDERMERFSYKGVGRPLKELWFFANHGYGAAALEYADEISMLLFTYTDTGEITPANEAARDKYAKLLKRRTRFIERQKQYREGFVFVQAPVQEPTPLAPVIPLFRITEEIA